MKFKYDTISNIYILVQLIKYYFDKYKFVRVMFIYNIYNYFFFLLLRSVFSMESKN